MIYSLRDSNVVQKKGRIFRKMAGAPLSEEAVADEGIYEAAGLFGFCSGGGLCYVGEGGELLVQMLAEGFMTVA